MNGRLLRGGYLSERERKTPHRVDLGKWYGLSTRPDNKMSASSPSRPLPHPLSATFHLLPAPPPTPSPWSASWTESTQWFVVLLQNSIIFAQLRLDRSPTPSWAGTSAWKAPVTPRSAKGRGSWCVSNCALPFDITLTQTADGDPRRPHNMGESICIFYTRHGPLPEPANIPPIHPCTLAAFGTG